MKIFKVFLVLIQFTTIFLLGAGEIKNSTIPNKEINSKHISLKNNQEIDQIEHKGDTLFFIAQNKIIQFHEDKKDTILTTSGEIRNLDYQQDNLFFIADSNQVSIYNLAEQEYIRHRVSRGIFSLAAITRSKYVISSIGKDKSMNLMLFDNKNKIKTIKTEDLSLLGMLGNVLLSKLSLVDIKERMKPYLSLMGNIEADKDNNVFVASWSYPNIRKYSSKSSLIWEKEIENKMPEKSSKQDSSKKKYTYHVDSFINNDIEKSDSSLYVLSNFTDTTQYIYCLNVRGSIQYKIELPSDRQFKSLCVLNREKLWLGSKHSILEIEL